MKRKDIKMTPYLQNFLNFDLGHMNLAAYPQRLADIEYAPGLCLDLYLPEKAAEKVPLVIAVYGGGWVSGFKEDRFVEPMIKPVRFGYAVAVPNYTLALDDTFPRPVQDLLHCIQFLKEHAEAYHLDPENITLWGESAGGHLVLDAGLIDARQVGVAADVSVHSILAMYPLTDPLSAGEQAQQLKIDTDVSSRDSVFGILMGAGYDDPQMMRLASPVQLIHAGMPKIVLQHGTADVMVPYLQSQEFYDRARQNDPHGSVVLELIPGKAHTDPWFYTDENVQHVLELTR